ncbi:hypothetical protein C1H46_013888 [Malus baccata]|uniref:RING-type E3 ubiquitin transferase n=1 Tax=Malus baccata TaxID=106549 RepID=A0A540MP46_MALBA|nr:hypothetical protein C1H46_013888 [Malus baccata]
MQKLFISSFCILLLVFFKLVGASQFTCSESKCSNDRRPAIHFPLRLTHHCGPGIECNQTFEQPILAKFFVKRIDYKRQEIQVHDAYYSNCLLLMKPEKIPYMSLSRFYLSVSDFDNVTLFSCPPVGTYDYWNQVPCLGDPGSTTYGVFGNYSFDSLLEELPSCTRMYDVLSVPIGTTLGKDYDVLRFKWSEPNCTECEAEGKRCRWKNNGTNSEIECVGKPSKDNIYLYSVVATYKHL